MSSTSMSGATASASPGRTAQRGRQRGRRGPLPRCRVPRLRDLRAGRPPEDLAHPLGRLPALRLVALLPAEQGGAARRGRGRLPSHARGSGPVRWPDVTAYVRIAPTDDGIAIDLGDPDWSGIEVDAQGWRHVTRPAVRFIRPRGLHALPVPVKGGGDHRAASVPQRRDDDAWRLVVGFLVMMFRPTGPLPGPRPSTASRAPRRARRCACCARLVDPRETLDRVRATKRSRPGHPRHAQPGRRPRQPLRPARLAQRCAGTAGDRCRLQHEAALHRQRRVQLQRRPADHARTASARSSSDPTSSTGRCSSSLAPIAESERKLEADFWADFEAAAPAAILGALLDAVSVAVARESSVTMASWPRMADFARWVTAAEPALGWTKGDVPQELLRQPWAGPRAGPRRRSGRGRGARPDVHGGHLGRSRDRVAGRRWPPMPATRRRSARTGPPRRTPWETGSSGWPPTSAAIGIEVGRDRTGNRRTITLSNVCETPSQPSSPSLERDSDDSDDGESPPSDKAKATDGIDWDAAETATDDDAEVPVCECGHVNVAAGPDRWVCTYAPGHAKASSIPMMTMVEGQA